MGDAFGIIFTVMTHTPAIPAAAAGIIWGIIGGALPGISPSIAMALVLPLTYTMQPVVAVILLAAVYCGAEYGGSIPGILIAVPGTNSAGASTIEGYQMQLRGRGGEALGISLSSGVIGGMIGLAMLVALTGPLSKAALAFRPPSYFAVGILGLSAIVSLSDTSLLKGLIPGVIGLIIATIGNDPISGVNRFTFGNINLIEGFGPILVMVGLFAVSELLHQSGLPDWPKAQAKTKIKLPSFKTWRTRFVVPHFIATIFGTVEGIIPGAGGTVAAFLSLNEAKRWSKTKDEWGKGNPEGVAAPECANNVVTGTALIPLLTFGIPGSNSAAVLLGGMLLHGLRPGPMLFVNSRDVVYGLFGGLFFANLFLLVIGMFSVRAALWLVNRPKQYVLAVVYALIFSGAFALNHSLFEPAVVLVMGVLGYLLRYLGFGLLPMVLGVVLGFMVETNFRRSMQLSGGNLGILVGDPISAVLLAISLGFMLYSLYNSYRGRANKAKAAAAA
jgi:putative tricarboxylic transport membrane protein